MKTEAAYKSEFNSLIVGATAMLVRAVQVRKNLGKLTGKGWYTTGPAFIATSAATKAVGAIKTFKGAFERNA